MHKTDDGNLLVSNNCNVKVTCFTLRILLHEMMAGAIFVTLKHIDYE